MTRRWRAPARPRSRRRRATQVLIRDPRTCNGQHLHRRRGARRGRHHGPVRLLGGRRRPGARHLRRRLAGGRSRLTVVLLSGGTGGAKLARGLLDECDDLVVVANTGDDAEVYGVHVSPDPDLVTYWLADEIDERGYGLRDDTWHVMDALDRGRPPGLVPARRPRPGDVPDPHRGSCAPAGGSPRRTPPWSRRWAWRRGCCRWPTSRWRRACSTAAGRCRSRST